MTRSLFFNRGGDICVKRDSVIYDIFMTDNFQGNAPGYKYREAIVNS